MANLPAVVFPSVAGKGSVLNITAATVVKATGGVVRFVAVNTAGTAVGGIYDATTTAGAVAANLAFAIPETVTAGPQEWKWLCKNGIVVVPPTGGVVSITFD